MRVKIFQSNRETNVNEISNHFKMMTVAVRIQHLNVNYLPSSEQSLEKNNRVGSEIAGGEFD